jgi:hypothetical protein
MWKVNRRQVTTKSQKITWTLVRWAEKALNFPENHPMNTPTNCGFREKDTFGLLFLVCTSSDQQKSINILEGHPMNIPTKVGSNGQYMTQWFQRRLRGCCARDRMIVGFITIQSVPITTNIVSSIPTRLKTRYCSNRNRTLHEWSLGGFIIR